MKDNANIYRKPPAVGGKPSNLVVFLHGYGADGKDLIDLANPFSMALPNAAFISPDAPFPAQCLHKEGNGFLLKKFRWELLMPRGVYCL